MQLQDLVISPDYLAYGTPPGMPLGFIGLESCPPDAVLGAQPTYPLIGLGAPDHPFAAAMDAILEGPVTPDTIIAQVLRAPKAASVTVQLLRSLEGVEPLRALTLESMAYGMLQGSAEHQAWLAARGPAVEPMPVGQVHVQWRGDTLCVTLDRPDAHNAIDTKMRDGIADAFAFAAAVGHIKRIELRALGEAFCVGGDLDEFGTTRDPVTAHDIRMFTLPALKIVPQAEVMDVHVQGACVGAGVEMTAFAKRVTASAHAWFQLPELAMGLIPGAGGCVSLPRRIGRQRAALMILSGKRINAKTALAWGLIDAIEEKSAQDAVS